MPIGIPACPELACCTASMDSARMALASWRRVVIAPLLAARRPWLRVLRRLCRASGPGARALGAHCPPVALDAQLHERRAGLGTRPGALFGIPGAGNHGREKCEMRRNYARSAAASLEA